VKPGGTTTVPPVTLCVRFSQKRGHVLKEMSMHRVTHVAELSDSTELVTVIRDSAAEIATRLHESELRNQKFQRELDRAQHQGERARQWILELRRSHRTESHAKTAGLFKIALNDLAELDTISQVGIKPVTTTTLFEDAIAS
jgi:excinuclease UvrABC nuclease subunit